MKGDDADCENAENKTQLCFSWSRFFTAIAQEPRLLSGLSEDSSMIESYKQDKDIYATLASGIYSNEYRLNLEYETYPDGSPVLDESGEKILYPEGKKRRGSVKSLLLGESMHYAQLKQCEPHMWV